MKTILLAAATALAIPATASAHFLLEYTEDTMIEAPGEVPVKLIFWHPFENGHVMDLEMPQEFFVLHNGERTDLLGTLEPVTFTGGENEGVLQEPGRHLFRQGQHGRGGLGDLRNRGVAATEPGHGAGTRPTPSCAGLELSGDRFEDPERFGLAAAG